MDGLFRSLNGTPPYRVLDFANKPREEQTYVHSIESGSWKNAVINTKVKTIIFTVELEDRILQEPVTGLFQMRENLEQPARCGLRAE
jgi:hypothetical protein